MGWNADIGIGDVMTYLDWSRTDEVKIDKST